MRRVATDYGLDGPGIETLRVPLTTLQRSVCEGGWNLVNIWAKSRALFVLRLRAQGQREGTPKADWLKKWNISTEIQHSPLFWTSPGGVGIHTRIHKRYSIYTKPQDLMDFVRRAKRKVYMQKYRHKLVAYFLSLKHHTSQEASRSKQVRSWRHWSATRMI